MAKKVVQKKQSKKTQQSRPRPLKSIALGFVLTCFAFYLAITAIETAIKINETNDKIDVAKTQYEKIVSDNEYTANLLKNADEKDIVERIARERLGYVFPDEKVFQDVN